MNQSKPFGYTDYAANLTASLQSRLAASDLASPATVNITLATNDASSDDFDDHAPIRCPRNAVEQAIDDAIANTPTPSALQGTPLDRLDAALGRGDVAGTACWSIAPSSARRRRLGGRTQRSGSVRHLS